jgi:hypothetical protein
MLGGTLILYLVSLLESKSFQFFIVSLYLLIIQFGYLYKKIHTTKKRVFSFLYFSIVSSGFLLEFVLAIEWIANGALSRQAPAVIADVASRARVARSIDEDGRRYKRSVDRRQGRYHRISVGRYRFAALQGGSRFTAFGLSSRPVVTLTIRANLPF